MEEFFTEFEKKNGRLVLLTLTLYALDDAKKDFSEEGVTYEVLMGLNGKDKKRANEILNVIVYPFMRLIGTKIIESISTFDKMSSIDALIYDWVGLNHSHESVVLAKEPY